MYFYFGIFYLVLLVIFGILTFRKRHIVLFILGFFMPLFWLIGALLPPSPRAR